MAVGNADDEALVKLELLDVLEDDVTELELEMLEVIELEVFDVLDEVELEVLVDITGLDVLVGVVLPNGAQVAPRDETSLKVSADIPLTTPYFEPSAETTA